jgi:hypothetical protein
MILYNVTVSLDESIHQEWLTWMRNVHIPDVMNTGCFSESRLSRIMAEEEEAISYAITYVAESMDTLDEYRTNHAPRLQKDHSEKFAGRFAAFRTFLELVEEFKK